MADRQLFNPFPGLRPFGAEEDYLFFGREEQTRELLQLLRTHRFLAVVGTSGSGKSSLVRAGLLPALYGGTMVGVGSDGSTVVFRPGGDPLLNLAEAMIEADLYDPEDDEAPLRIRATLSRSRLGLVQSVKQSDLPEGTNLLIVVDQFEELFRFRDTSEEHQSRATAFVKLLLNAVADPELPIYVAITMRSDYLGDCAQLPGLAEAVNDGEYLIPKLTRDQKRDAIEKPVSVGGGQISPALVQQLLNDVGDDSDQLPILQHVLMRIWDKWELDQNAAGSIDLSHYDSVGGMNNALSLHADEVHDDLPDDDSRQLSMRLFQAITERSDDERGIRRPTRMDQLCEIVDGSPEEVAVVLDAYRQAGRTFVMPGQDVELNSETVVDISHESLMRVWQRLKGWVAEESQAVRIYRRLAETAALHAEDAAGVYRDPDLQIATSWRDNSQPTEAWAHRYHAGFTTAMEFLDKSWAEAHAEEEAREAARKRELEQARKLAESERKRAEVQAKAKKRVDILLAGISVALLIAVGMYLYAEKQREIAENNEELARTALDDKETYERQLKLKQRTDDLATAQAMFEQGNVGESLRSLQDACKREPTEPALLRPAMRYISQHNFFSATDTFNLQRRFAKDARVFPLKSLRGLAIAGKNGDLLLMSQGRSSPATTKFDAAVVQCAVAEKHLQVLTADGTVHCWWPDEDRQLSIHKQLEDEAGFPATFPANSVTFVAGHIAVHSGQTLWLIAMDQNQSPLIVKRFTLEASQSILRAAVTTDLTRAFLVDQDEHYRLIDLVKEPTEIRSFPAQSEVVFMTELPLQGKLMSVEREGLIHLVDAMAPKLDMVLDVENAATSVKHILVRPDSTRLAILSQSGDIGVFNLADGEPFFTQQENKSFQFEVIRFDPSGVAIAGTDRDGHLAAIDSETGQQLVVPSVVKVIPGSFYVAQPLDSDGRPQAGLFVGGHPTGRVLATGRPNHPRLVQWKLVMRLPNQADLLPQGDAIRQRTLSSGFSALFCNYWIGRISGFGQFQGGPGSPGGRGIDYGPMQNFTRAVIERETQQPSRFFNPEALANYWSEQAASGKPLSLARAVLSSQLTPKVLAASRTMASPEQPGNLSARYHQIHFLRQHFQLADDE